MSTKYDFLNRPVSTRTGRKKISLKPSKMLITRSKLKHNGNHSDLTRIFPISKSPVVSLHKQNSFILSRKKSYQTTNASASPLSRNIQKIKKRQKPYALKQKKRKLSMGFLSSRPENFRYQNKTMEESESYKYLNGVSTPPEEDPVRDRCKSPFSDIIEQDLSNYINQPLQKLCKLQLPKKSFGTIEDSYQYSTSESRKQESSKFSFERKGKVPEPPKTPPPFSIYSKILNVSSLRIRNKPSKKN